MKKIILIISLILIASGLFGQTQLKKGLIVGADGVADTVIISKITIDGDNLIKIYQGTIQRYMYGQLKIADTAAMLTPYVERKDTASMLTNYLHNSTVSVTEAGYLNGVTSAIQTQLSVTTVPTQINDSIAARLAAATVGVALADSNDYAPYHYATPSFVKSFVGSNTSLTGKRLQFIADVTTGAPEAGDTILIHSNFINKHVDIYRDGAKQYKNFTATNTVEGYRIRTGSDTIYVNPAFQANEQIIVDMIEPINWEFISVKDQDLLDGLVAYYKFDETSGTALADEIGGNTATLDGDINQTGIINQAVGLTANNDDIVIPYSEGVTLGESEQFSVSMWFYAEDLPSTIGRTFVLFQQNNSVSPIAPHRAGISSTTNKIYFIVNTDAPDDIWVYSADAITADTWHHVVFICPGSGGALQIWVNGVDVSTSAETVNGNLRDGDQYLCVGNAYNAATSAFYGEIDEFAIYNKVLTESEILKLYNSGSGNQYPFE